MLNRSAYYYGTKDPPPEKTVLFAGPISLVYDSGSIRYLRVGNVEVVRRVYAAVRGAVWNTIPNQISNEIFDVDDQSFRITFDVVNQDDTVDFSWQGIIEGSQSGDIRFTFTGEAHKDFYHSRTGFCVLHPLNECNGKPCWIETSTGETKEANFPYHINSIQPLPGFTDIRSMMYECAPGIKVTIGFSGDLFETEDQRNWSDGSYKTYCTPLGLGYPRLLQKGTRISQVIDIHAELQNGCCHDSYFQPEITEIKVYPTRQVPLSRIGLETATHGLPLSVEETNLLKALNLSHIRHEVKFDQMDWRDKFLQASKEALSLGASLEVALFIDLPAEDQLTEFVQFLEMAHPKICRWLVFGPGILTTDPAVFRMAKKILSNWNPDIPVGGGSNANYFELDHFPVPFQEMDCVSFGITPQVHAYDHDTLIEGLEAHAFAMKSAHNLAAGKPICVGPITLKPRFNADAPDVETQHSCGDLPPQVDGRQNSLLAAGWTLGCLKRLMEGAASSITLYETTGWRGVIEFKTGPELPHLFLSKPGSKFPIYYILRDIGEYSGGDLISVASSDPSGVIALGLKKQERLRLLIANLTASIKTIRVSGFNFHAQVSYLDEETFNKPVQDQVEFALEFPNQGQYRISLLPYAIARLDNYEI